MVPIKSYNSIFYEFQALSSLSKSHPVMVNVRVPEIDKFPDEWLEIDGIIKKSKKTCVEVKSFPLSDRDIGEIVNKFNLLKEKNYFFDDYSIVAPRFIVKKNYDVSLIPFLPDLDFIKKFYERFEPKLPDIFIDKLCWHHFRFQSPFGERTFKNQIDKRISSTSKLKKEINNRLSWPPLRVFWSVLKYVNPKELFYKSTRNYPLGGPIFLDLDCADLHYPCIIKDGICENGMKRVKEESKRIIEVLNENGYSEIYRVFSGKKGFHFYIFDTKSKTKSEMIKERVSVVDVLLKERIKIDAKKTTDIKLATSFPSSLNGISLKEIEVLDKH